MKQWVSIQGAIQQLPTNHSKITLTPFIPKVSGKETQEKSVGYIHKASLC